MTLITTPIMSPPAPSESLLAQILNAILGNSPNWTYKEVSASNINSDPTRIDYYDVKNGVLVMHEIITYDVAGTFQSLERLTP